MTGWPRTYKAPKTVEQELAEYRQLEFDAWDEDFERATGKIPSFSRLIIARAMKLNISVAQADEMFGHGDRWECLPQHKGKQCMSRPMGIRCGADAEEGLMYCPDHQPKNRMVRR